MKAEAGQIEAGDLDRRITISRAVVTKDALGAAVEVWSTYAVMWAAMAFQTSTDQTRADEWAAATARTFTVRWGTISRAITPMDRVIFEGHTFNISGLKEIGTRKAIEISAAARAE